MFYIFQVGMFLGLGGVCFLVLFFFFKEKKDLYISFICNIFLCQSEYLPSDCSKIDFEENRTVHPFSI